MNWEKAKLTEEEQSLLANKLSFGCRSYLFVEEALDAQLAKIKAMVEADRMVKLPSRPNLAGEAEKGFLLARELDKSALTEQGFKVEE